MARIVGSITGVDPYADSANYQPGYLGHFYHLFFVEVFVGSQKTSISKNKPADCCFVIDSCTS